MMDSALTKALMRHAEDWGIDHIGITDASILTTHTYAVSKGTPYRCGQQRARTEVAKDQFDPKTVMRETTAVIIMGTYTYGLDHIVPSTPGCPRGKIGPWTRIYETMSQQMADVVLEFLTERGYQAVFTNDLPYRTLALKAGLGDVGRNHFIFTKEHGCYLRFSCVVTNAPLETVSVSYTYDVERACGHCRRCVDSCPTQAMEADGTFHYDICLHQLLQGKGDAQAQGIPRQYWGKTMGYLMRTGHCLEVCPRNKKLVPRDSVPRYMKVYPDFAKPDSPPLIPLVLASDEEMEWRLPVAVYKYGKNHVRQNAILALGQAKDPAASDVLARCLFEDAQVLNAAMAAWALGEIGTEAARNALQAARAIRTESQVLDEIGCALADGE